jgi:hypothetical protein
VQNNINSRAMAGQSFVYGIINNFPQTVHETTAIGRTDVHTGPLANRIQTF